MRLLGAILAGGTSRRFGSDKGAALFKGSALIDRVFAALAPQVTDVVIVGREWPGLRSLGDRPAGQLGPLAGLNAALHCALEEGYEAVLSAGCDTLPVPTDLATALSGACASFVAGHYLMGFWPTPLAGPLEAHLSNGEERSMRGWIERCGAKPVAFATAFHNLNTPEDLAAYTRNS